MDARQHCHQDVLCRDNAEIVGFDRNDMSPQDFMRSIFCDSIMEEYSNLSLDRTGNDSEKYEQLCSKPNHKQEADAPPTQQLTPTSVSNNDVLNIKSSAGVTYGIPVEDLLPHQDTSFYDVTDTFQTPDHKNKQSTVLPPCRICGDAASGYHYGAYTCEACKVFFRRSLKKSVPYRCQKNGQCTILPNKRLTCSSCRLQKCHATGMSKDSIKRGRYTLEKKTDCIREVKKLEDEEKARAAVPPTSPTPNTYDEIIENIYHNHMKFNPYSQELVDSLPTKEAQYLQEVKALEEVFGPFRLISQEEYNDLYNNTGIDIDGRMHEIASHLPQIEERIQHLVCFAKSLPGFRDLPVEDQIALVKAGGFDCWLLHAHVAINLEHRLYTCACGATRTDKEMGRLINLELINHIFLTARHLQRLSLTQHEIGLFKAFCLLSPDRVVLKEREKVEKAQELVFSCLRYLIDKTRPDDILFIGKMTSALLSIRTATHLHKKYVLPTLHNFSNVNFPPLLLEFVAT